MMDSYRVRYRLGDFEVEVESSDKEYVEAKLTELISTAALPAVTQNEGSRRRQQARVRQSHQTDAEIDSQGTDIPEIIALIKDSDSYSAIEGNVLNKSAQLPRVMLPLYFAAQVPSAPDLTTGDIQTITDQLGVRVRSNNAADTIKKNLKYFTASVVRKRGTRVPYKLNRTGLQAFERLLQGGSL